MENYMQKVMIKKCLVYILNNIFLFILLNCNSNNYLLSKYTLSTNLVLCFFSILMIFNNEYIFCSILNIYQIFKNEIIIRQSRKKYLKTIEYSANGRPLVTVEKSTQYAKQVHLTKKLNTVGSPF